MARVKAKLREIEARDRARIEASRQGTWQARFVDSSSEVSGISMERDFRDKGRFFDTSLVCDSFLPEGLRSGVQIAFRYVFYLIKEPYFFEHTDYKLYGQTR